MRTIHVACTLALFLFGPLGVAVLTASGVTSQVTDEPLPLVHYQRRPIIPGREEQAFALVQRMTVYLDANYGDEYRPLALYVDQDELHWFVDLTNLAAYWDLRARLHEDEGWRALLDQGDGVFEAEGGSELRLFPIGGAGPNRRPIATRILRSTRAPFSKLPLSRAFAKRLVEYLEATYEGIDARAYSADMDDPSAIFVMIDFYDWVTWDAIRLSMLDDEGYLKLFEEAEGLFLDEQTHELQLD